MNRFLAILSVILVCGTALASPLGDPQPPRVSDEELAGRVRGALHASLGVGAGRIDVAARDGFIFLYGDVPNERLKSRAETIAERVPGVRSVNNELALDRNRASTTVGRRSAMSIPQRNRRVQK